MQGSDSTATRLDPPVCAGFRLWEEAAPLVAGWLVFRTWNRAWNLIPGTELSFVPAAGEKVRPGRYVRMEVTGVTLWLRVTRWLPASRSFRVRVIACSSIEDLQLAALDVVDAGGDRLQSDALRHRSLSRSFLPQ